MKKTSQETAESTATSEIMTKPLPQILDELKGYIKSVEDAVKAAQAAALESKGAALRAKESGEKAAEAAKKAAEAAVAKVKEETATALTQVLGRLFESEEKVRQLSSDVRAEALAVDDALLAAKNKHVEGSPFLEK
jgi:exonuclease V gamma subunit